MPKLQSGISHREYWTAYGLGLAATHLATKNEQSWAPGIDAGIQLGCSELILLRQCSQWQEHNDLGNHFSNTLRHMRKKYYLRTHLLVILAIPTKSASDLVKNGVLGLER